MDLPDITNDYPPVPDEAGHSFACDLTSALIELRGGLESMARVTSQPLQKAIENASDWQVLAATAAPVLPQRKLAHDRRLVSTYRFTFDAVIAVLEALERSSRPTSIVVKMRLARVVQLLTALEPHALATDSELRLG